MQNIEEKSVSISQQKAAGIALAAKRGEFDPSKLTGAAKQMYKMSEKDLEDFAKTKHKGLPMKKEEEVQTEQTLKDIIDAVMSKKKIKIKGSPGKQGQMAAGVEKHLRSKGLDPNDYVQYMESFDVKTAKSKMGKIDVKSFDDLDAAKAHLEKMKKKGHKGIISKNGKPVNESKEAYQKVFNAAMKKFKINSIADLKTDELKKKFFNYVDANYKAKDEETDDMTMTGKKKTPVKIENKKT